MGFIDKAQNTALEIIGLILMIVGGAGLVISGISIFTGADLLVTISIVTIFIAILAVGTICAGYRAIPRLLIQIINVIKK
jgi:hypothetical protein